MKIGNALLSNWYDAGVTKLVVEVVGNLGTVIVETIAFEITIFVFMLILMIKKCYGYSGSLNFSQF